MNKLKKVCLEISERLSNLPYDDGDGSDIGNEVGIIIAKHFSEDHGWDMNGFLFGVNHGIDLTLNKDKDGITKV